MDHILLHFRQLFHLYIQTHMCITMKGIITGFLYFLYSSYVKQYVNPDQKDNNNKGKLRFCFLWMFRIFYPYDVQRLTPWCKHRNKSTYFNHLTSSCFDWVLPWATTNVWRRSCRKIQSYSPLISTKIICT